MKKTSETIVFFGSGPVAAESLRLLNKSFNIEAVITKHSTTQEMTDISDGAPVFSIGNKQDLIELFAKHKFSSNAAVLIDFGIIVSESIIDGFPLGIVNSHFSALPEWRGADPITFSILSGQEKTGVSLMLLVSKMDEGPILACKEHTISPKTTTPELTKELIKVSYELLKEYLPLYLAKKLTPVPQEQLSQKTKIEPSYSRKIAKQDGVINWGKPAKEIEREIRAYAGWPKSHTNLANKDVIITASHVADAVGTPGSVTVSGKELIVHCGKGSLVIERLQPAGKKEMPIEAFLAGYKNNL